MKSLILIVTTLMFFGCASLKLRDGKSTTAYKKESPAVVALRQQVADLRAKNQAYEEQFRMSSGKVEELEILNRRLEDSSNKRLGEESQELQAYKESVSELVAEKKRLELEVLQLKEENKKANLAVKSAKRTAGEHLKAGDELFDDKKWSEAAAEFQAFREKAGNKKNEDYALSTYKIGVCFQELGLNKEAKTFYKSVVAKHKKTKASKFAQYRLENMK